MAFGIYSSASFLNASGLAQISASSSVEVRRESDNGIATLYADVNGATPLANPFSADTDGNFAFYAAGLARGYKVTVTKGASVRVLRNQKVGTAGEFDISDAVGATLNSATLAAFRAAIGLSASLVTARSSNTIIGVADYATTFNCTSSFTQTFGPAADLGAGFFCRFVNSGTGVITLDPNASETIDGATTIRLLPGEACFVHGNGSAFVTVGRLASTYVGALKWLINGNTYANNAADATNDIDIAAGGCMDDAAAYWMEGGALTKRLDAAWAAGTNAGGLDTGAIANADYYIWRIARVDTGVVDVLFSLSSTAPTMPANYTVKRLIGWFKRVGATIVAFKTYETEGGGLEMIWNSPTLDVNLANTLTTTRRTDAVKVPLNFSVTAHISALIQDGTSPFLAWLYCPDQTDLAPSNSAAPLTNVSAVTAAQFAGQMHIRTSATGTIAARADLATVDVYRVATIGFTWARRN